MKKKLIAALFLLAFPFVGLAVIGNEYNPQSVGAGNPDVHIKSDGSITLTSGRVDQVAGSTYYLGIKWGTLPMRFTMTTNARTTVTKRYGGVATVSQIRVGDYIDVEGEFFVGSDFFGMNALRVKDWSLQEEAGIFSGVVTELKPSEQFILRTPQNQNITVRLATSSAVSIKKGNVIIPFGRLKKGDAIPIISGVYDYSQNLLTADKIVVYQSRADFTPRNFEGTLKQVVSAEIPATLVVTAGGIDYTVKLSAKTAVLKKDRSVANLARFVAGDTVRFYGTMREEEKTLSDALVVDAEIVRNLSL